MIMLLSGLALLFWACPPPAPDEGPVRDGGSETAVRDGVATDGVADDGVATDGVADDGVAIDGVADDGVAIAVSVPPLAWLAEELGGDQVTVSVIVPPGATADNFEPSPRILGQLDGARIFIGVGHPHLTFEQRFLMPRLDEDVTVVSLAGSLDHTALHANVDPHLWLSPALMREAAGGVATALCDLGVDCAVIEERQAALADVFDQLDQDIAITLSDLSRKAIFVEHPAWGWLLRTHGIEQVAIEDEGKAPAAATLVALVTRAREAGARQVFVQPGGGSRVARAFADEIEAEIVVVDPLARDWAANLIEVSAQFRAALTAP
ncbi:MAG: zinc ABC transporter substrate-binding protein [Acidobacteriota bacterium]